MRINALELTNIRSYLHEKISFPKGLVLLAGDIGSGKSTILLALEFALFGIQRGELSGTSLLRHGSQKGSVTLECTIDGKDIKITRGLKRTATTVGQDTGSIAIDGVTTELSAQELKAKVLQLLNYPESLLSTGKRPLFRYTVYTPQEEMKTILYEKADDRLETLRRLFNIDKYKRVRENALNLIKELRKEETGLKARIDEIGKQLVDREEVAKELGKIEEEARRIATRLAAATTAYEDAKKEVEERERERFKREELKKRYALAKNKVELLLSRRKETERDEEDVTKQIDATDLKKADVDEERLKEHETILREHETKIKEKEDAIVQQEAEHHATIKQAKAVIEGIAKLDTCPTCKQPVTPEHKGHIDAVEGKRITVAEEKCRKLDELKEALTEKRAQLEKKQQELLQKQRLVAANKEKLKTLEMLKKKQLQIGEAKRRFEKELSEEKERGMAIKRELDASEFDQEAHARAKTIADGKRESLTKMKIAAAEAQKDVERLKKDEERIRKQGEERNKHEKLLKTTQQRLAWLNKQLLNVSHAIEKQLFSTVYGLFNEYFKEWFATLMEDETISVRLDSDFVPVIVQDGYETSIEHLSGGEKTSVALSYRLSLNKAINEFLTDIKTRDLLILDEPTDGFSSEQLDRVREVLDQLKLEQVLIVSHEQQMEGYVDHVLRVEKQEHESKLII